MSSLDRLMLDHSEQMMLLVEAEGLRILGANRTAARTLGYSVEQLLGKTITEIESSLQDVFYWDEVRNGQYQAIELQEGLYLCADGSILSVSKSVRIVEHEGQRLFLVQARDMQNERMVEEELEQTLSALRATLESTGNGILVIDGQGRIANMNRLFSSLWKIPRELLLGHDDEAILDFIAASVVDSELCRRRLREIADSNETEDTFELHDGRVFECRSRAQYSGESIVGRVFGYDDITQRKQAEQVLRESRDELEKRVLERTVDLRASNTALQAEKRRQEELNRELAEAHVQLLQSEKMASVGQLAAGIAHEINNPVGFVNSNLGSLQRYLDDLLQLLAAYEQAEAELGVDSRAALSELRQKIDLDFLREDLGSLLTDSIEGLLRIKRIVQDLKIFSHVAGTEKQWANLEQGLDSTLNVVWNELKYKAEVIKEYAGVSEIQCISSQLNQVFMNLLINAAQAIEGHGRITIRTGENAGNVWVEVEDTGKGIQPEHLDRIFDPFFTTKPVGSGTGLGLSLSYGIVQQHGGRIEVASEPGKGSTFRVILPRPVGEAEAAAST